jgi:carbamoyl-phosphate synthase large subunit
MHDSLTILFTSAGRRNQLLGCFREDATRLGIELRVLAADIRPQLSPACHAADSSFTVPRCTAPEYIPALLEICRAEHVDLLVPTIDPELAVLSAGSEAFAAAGTRALVASTDTIAVAGDKLATAQRLAAAGVSVARTVTLENYRSDPAGVRWPVIAKPRGGSSSVGIIRPRDAAGLASLPASDYVVQECWSGREYTINVFFDQAGTLRCAVPHLRIETRGGEVSKGRTERLPVLADAANKLAAALPGARGPMCFQAIVADSGDYAVFEINARFGGGYPLAHRAGARMSQWLLEELTGRPSSAHDDWHAGVTMLRYDEAVFLDD